jgi:HEAT repeat protein
MGKDDNASEAGFLALGSLGLAARRANVPEAVTLVERTLSTELARRDARRLVLIEAAGNAACEACTPELVRALGDADPWTRRAAAASLRFRADRASLTRTCAVLDRDVSPSVREHAAWALAFEESFASDRAGCLARAAASDDDLDVRRTATRSLTRLTGENVARDRALFALAKEPNPRAVRLVALEHLALSDPTPVTEVSLP